MTRGSTRTATLAAAAAVCAMLLASTPGRSQGLSGRGTSAAPLTNMDYVALRQLVARYAWALDSGADNGFALADLFTDDGESVNPDARGRAQLATQARGGRLGPMFVHHYAMNPVIEPSPQGAVGRQYVIEIDIDDNGQPARGQQLNARGAGARGQRGAAVDQWSLVGRRGGAVSAGGRYEDVYARTSAGWRFKRREYIPSKSGPRPNAALPDAAVGHVTSGNLAAAAGSKESSGSGSALGVMDYLEIEQLVSSYGHALDSGFGADDNGVAYEQLFALGGIFYSRGRPYQGEQLRELARAQPHGPQYARHFLTNHVIEPSAEGATGKQYLVVIDIGENGKPGTIFLGGHYQDVYVRTPEGWRFKTRRSFGSLSGPQ